MELSFTEEQEMLRKSAHDFLANECPPAVVRDAEQDERGYPQELWQKMADLGWMGLVIPDEYDGTGQSFFDLVILLEEMGRAVLPGPFFSTVVLGALPLLIAGSEEQKRDLLPKIANGKLIMTTATFELNVDVTAEGVKTTAKEEIENYVLNGTKLLVPYAHVADYIICAARTKALAKLDEGITLFLVDTKSKGVTTTMLGTMANDKQCEVVLDKVEVPQKNILGEVNKGWPIMQQILERAAVAECALMVGSSQWIMDATTEYSKTRVAFGVPIGSFEVVKHRLADMLADLYCSQYITYQAAWRIDEGLPCTKETSFAKAWVNEAHRRICLGGNQTHGGIGYTWDHDIGLYWRRSKPAEISFGDADHHLKIVAEQLGL